MYLFKDKFSCHNLRTRDKGVYATHGLTGICPVPFFLLKFLWDIVSYSLM